MQVTLTRMLLRSVGIDPLKLLPTTNGYFATPPLKPHSRTSTVRISVCRWVVDIAKSRHNSRNRRSLVLLTDDQGSCSTPAREK